MAWYPQINKRSKIREVWLKYKIQRKTENSQKREHENTNDDHGQQSIEKIKQIENVIPFIGFKTPFELICSWRIR